MNTAGADPGLRSQMQAEIFPVPPKSSERFRSRLQESAPTDRNLHARLWVILPAPRSNNSFRISLMAVGVRTDDLRKVYTSAPPLGAGGGFIPRAEAKNSRQPKPQITALNGLSLEIEPGEIDRKSVV